MNDNKRLSYNSPNYNQITLKAERDIVKKIREIAEAEERTIQTITNRFLKKALKLYEQEKSHYLK